MNMPPDARDESDSSDAASDEEDSGIMAEDKTDCGSADEKPTGHGNSTTKPTKSNAKDPSRPKRKKARRACFACQRAHLTCGMSKPFSSIKRFVQGVLADD